ncbi:axin-1-like isoform X1 [Penaeus monodon]|uniref:axin-1-like isoform X1 n=1 Tax=Penaeus monodon TaxID=6687 RepID=UPI0018A7B1C2|nr:axin-1-like isoform X1 [Penaeus monodon]XP_037788938.1 axin-1-like isoform X1 [Penaeus monodon]
MSSTSPEPPPGVQPGGPAGDQTGGPQTLAHSPQKTPQSQHSIEGETVGGAETCGRLDPRPPVPGGEDVPGQHHFHHGEWAKESLEDWGKPGQCLSPEAPLPIHSPCPGEGGGDGPALAGGSVEGGSPCFGGGEGGSTPPVIRWSYSLPQLLEDSQGVQLFQEFLKEECGSCESLHFWFACNGLRKSTQDPSQLVTIIWKRFIRNFVVRVSEKTYKIVNDRINARSIDRNIFDDAQREVEEEIARSTYPSFLKSERYLLYLDAASQQAGGAGTDSPHTPSPGSPGNGGSGAGTGGVLPTLHEDCEFEGTAATGHIRLTQGALAATVKQRAAAERRRPEAFAGQYLHGSSGCVGGGVNPYHAVYASAHVSSRLDSELQSLSSDALTDDTMSCTDSSVDGMSVGFGRNINPKYLKRQYHKMRENARQNRELALSAATGGSFPSSAGGGGGGILHGGVPFVPRTHRLRHESVPNLKPPEFAALLIERLEKVKRDRESQEKVQQSFKKIQEGDNVSDECRRQHAFNSLPPSLLLDKLNQKIPLDDVDPCQSILDEHVSRVWQDSNNDTPARSPGSPRPKSPSGRRPGAQPRPLPLSSKGMVSGTHPSMYVSGSSYLSSVQPGHQGHLPPGHPAHLPPGHPALLPPGHPLHLPPGHPAHLPPGHLPHPYQASKNWHHTRRRDRGQDVNSTFSSDSGNVADYYESNERGALHPLPKSRSMPEYMENYAGTSSDGGSSGRRQSSGRRSSSRRPPADLTDSGVSVVSDSGPSLAPSASSTERVTSWLLESDKFSGSGSTSSVYPEHEWDPRLRGSRSTHTAAGATSPGTLRRSASSGGRRSVSGGSVGGSGTLANTGSNVSASGSLSGGSVGGGRSGSLDRGPAGWVTAGMEQGGHMGHGMHAPHMPHSHAVHGSHASHSEEKRRSRGGGSSRSGGHSSSHGWGHPESGSSRNQGHGDGSGPVCPGSNGSTLRKQRPSRHSQPTPPGMYEGSGVSGGSSSTGSGGGACGGGCAGAGGSASTAGGGLGGGGGGSGSVMSTATESTTVIYNFHDDDVPFVTRIPTRPVTLRRFKQHLPKKGNYRFFFKKQCEEFGVIQEEVTDDQEVLPLFDGKIFAQIRKAD